MGSRIAFGAALAVALLVSGPACAYTLTGVLAPGGDSFYTPITFNHDGNVSLAVTFSSASQFYVDSSSALIFLNLDFYDFFDPQTGEHLGGDDNFGADAPWQQFGADYTGPIAPTVYHFTLDFPSAGTHHPYVDQAPGDPYPSLVGYTETLLNLNGIVFGNAAPVTHTVDVFGSAVVPEPATWSLLVIGFGIAGVAVRRRRLPVPA